MCGRFTLRTLPDNIEKHFGVRFRDGKYHPRYNVAPSQAMPVIPGDSDEIIWMQWGMTPNWWKQKGRSLINIRSESLADKFVFKNWFKSQRCLVPADGFYEWKESGGKKQPYFISLKTDGLFAFPGLWDTEQGKNRFAIITCEPNSLMMKIHNRMPCILKPEQESIWRDPGVATQDLFKLLKPYPASSMQAHQVSLLVNSPTNDEKDLIQAIA